MKIYEAVKEALKKGNCIKRESIRWEHIRILPTNSYDGCYIIHEQINGKTTSLRGWNPQTEDLLAEDWKVVGREDEG